nr:MAG TPA: dissimilatory sulfite reductase D [Caudoviricetes sp.]
MKDLPPVSKLVEKLGLGTTSVYVQLYDLYRKQRRRQGHFHDGRYWVRMPYEDFPRMFPELSSDAVCEALGRLEDKGLLRMVHYGRLSWYVISRKASACRPKNVLY